jgi:DNA-directed RNA polymerase subunit F
MWQRAFVLEYASKITAIDPTAAAGAFDEMLGLIRGRLSNALANVFPAREVHAFIAPISSCVS